MAPDAIELHCLSKRFRSRVALDGLELAVPRGVVAGFVGPNGAGKTTTLRVLLGLMRPSAGWGSVLGCPLDNPGRYLHRVGAVIDAPALYPGLSGFDNLRLLAAAGGLDRRRIPAVLDRVELTHRAADPYRSFSMGMKQRLGIAAALLNDPELLVLDEPTNGLDPGGMHDMRALVRGLARNDLTVFLSSHLLSEVEEICDWITMIDRGRQVYEGPAAELLASESGLVFRPSDLDDIGMLADLVTATTKHSARIEDGTVVVNTADDLDALAAAVNNGAFARGITLVEIHRIEGRLERTYLELVEGSLA
jgi:ABC-2 type transport system ATP-binding protein